MPRMKIASHRAPSIRTAPTMMRSTPRIGVEHRRSTAKLQCCLLPGDGEVASLGYRGASAIRRMTMGSIDPTRPQFDAFKALPRDQPVHMLNLVRVREVADYPAEHPLHGQG